MPDQLDSNQSFDDRTEEIKATIKSLFQDLEIDELEIPSVYLENNWGSLSNTVLYSALLEMKKRKQILTAQQILQNRNRVPQKPSNTPSTHEEPEEVSETWVRRRQPVITKDISWFINNGDSEEIRSKAREHRERILLDLYLEHVKMTGETYFPEMHRLLKAEWDFSYKDEG